MKNPFMSMFLSQANRVGNQVVGAARAQATAAIKRETAKNMNQWTRAWGDALLLPAAPVRKKKATRRK